MTMLPSAFLIACAAARAIDLVLAFLAGALSSTIGTLITSVSSTPSRSVSPMIRSTSIVPLVGPVSAGAEITIPPVAAS